MTGILRRSGRVFFRLCIKGLACDIKTLPCDVLGEI